MVLKLYFNEISLLSYNRAYSYFKKKDKKTCILIISSSLMIYRKVMNVVSFAKNDSRMAKK
uniref:Uncharacterized protein n=1 Tax=Arundo donax TaxID=35708 RepID=A0A0A9BTA8_ARUDO